MKPITKMKKILLPLFVCASIIVLSSACKRCSTCSYTYRPYGTLADSTVEVAQSCGNKQDRTAYENSVKADAALVGGVVTCDN